MARLIRWIGKLGRRFLLPLLRRLSLPSLSSLVLYFQAVMMILLILRKPIWSFWYGTPYTGDRSLPGLYDDYFRTSASVCSVWVKAAWNNDLSLKRIVIAVLFIFVFGFGIFRLYMGTWGSENLSVEEQDAVAHDRKIIMIFYWYFLASAMANLAALRFDRWMAGTQGQEDDGVRQEQDDDDNVRARRARDRLDNYLNNFENWEPEEDTVQRNSERRGAISEQGGLGPRGFGPEVGLRERFAHVYPQD